MTSEPQRRGAPIRSITAVLPALDEAANIVSVVDATLDALSDVVPDYDLVVVDDGSKDATPRLADELAIRYPQVRVIHHPKNRGYGSAWRSGIEAATKQYIFLMDSDRQYNPAELTQLVQWNDQYDVVAGYRLRRSDTFPRVFLGWWFKVLVRLLFGPTSRDATCGFLLVRSSLLKAMTLESRGILIRTEVLYRARQQGAALREVGIRHYPRRAGSAKGARPLVMLRAARELIALRRRITRERRAAALAAQQAAAEAQPPPPTTEQPAEAPGTGAAEADGHPQRETQEAPPSAE